MFEKGGIVPRHKIIIRRNSKDSINYVIDNEVIFISAGIYYRVKNGDYSIKKQMLYPVGDLVIEMSKYEVMGSVNGSFYLLNKRLKEVFVKMLEVFGINSV